MKDRALIAKLIGCFGIIEIPVQIPAEAPRLAERENLACSEVNGRLLPALVRARHTATETEVEIEGYDRMIEKGNFSINGVPFESRAEERSGGHDVGGSNAVAGNVREIVRHLPAGDRESRADQFGRILFRQIISCFRAATEVIKERVIQVGLADEREFKTMRLR